LAEPTPSPPPVRAPGTCDPDAGAVPPPGLSHRGASLFAAAALGAWGIATLLAPWLAPRITELADRVERTLGVELVPQEMDR
jgi:hypothetical protein